MESPFRPLAQRVRANGKANSGVLIDTLTILAERDELAYDEYGPIGHAPGMCTMRPTVSAGEAILQENLYASRAQVATLVRERDQARRDLAYANAAAAEVRRLHEARCSKFREDLRWLAVRLPAGEMRDRARAAFAETAPSADRQAAS